MQPGDSDHRRIPFYESKELPLGQIPSTKLKCNPLNHFGSGGFINSCYSSFSATAKGDRCLSFDQCETALRQVFSEVLYPEISQLLGHVKTDQTVEPAISFHQFVVLSSAIAVFSDIRGSKNGPVSIESVHGMLNSKNLKATKSQVSNMLQYKEMMSLTEFYDVYKQNPVPHSYYFLRSWYHHERSNTEFRKLHENERLEKEKPLSAVNDFLAGTFAGIMITLSGHPFDTVKVRLQTSTAFSGAFNCAKDTFQKEGIFGFYRGMGGPIVTIPIINAVVFGAFGQCKLWFGSENLTLSQIAVSGGFAGLANCFVATPVELVKTKLQVQYSSKSANSMFKGPYDCARRVYLKRGVHGLFTGFSATVYRDVPGYAATFYVYEYLKTQLLPYNSTEKDLSPLSLTFAGGMAGVIGWGVSYPMDFVKSHLQAQGDLVPRYKRHPILLDGGFFDCLDKQTRKHGITHLWRGFGSCATRAYIGLLYSQYVILSVVANAVGFLSYEVARKALNQVES